MNKGKSHTKKHILRKLQPTLWSANVELLDPAKDRHYIIHQTLAYGDIEDFKNLFELYSEAEVKQTFSTVPFKDYRPARFHLVKNLLLKLKDAELNPNYYVKNTPRDLG